MNRIKRERESVGLSQKALARQIGTSQQAVSFYESGKREPKLETWQKLADALNVSVPYLQGFSFDRQTVSPGYSRTDAGIIEGVMRSLLLVQDRVQYAKLNPRKITDTFPAPKASTYGQVNAILIDAQNKLNALLESIKAK